MGGARLTRRGFLGGALGACAALRVPAIGGRPSYPQLAAAAEPPMPILFSDKLVRARYFICAPLPGGIPAALKPLAERLNGLRYRAIAARLDTPSLAPLADRLEERVLEVLRTLIDADPARFVELTADATKALARGGRALERLDRAVQGTADGEKSDARLLSAPGAGTILPAPGVVPPNDHGTGGCQDEFASRR